MFDNTAVKD